MRTKICWIRASSGLSYFWFLDQTRDAKATLIRYVLILTVFILKFRDIILLILETGRDILTIFVFEAEIPYQVFKIIKQGLNFLLFWDVRSDIFVYILNKLQLKRNFLSILVIWTILRGRSDILKTLETFRKIRYLVRKCW